jgi:hypothetical protein
MSGPCRNFEGTAFRVKNDLYARLPKLSGKALGAVLSLPTISYPKDWLNEPVTAADLKRQLFRATREVPNAFLWVERYDAMWVNLRSALPWWNERYGIYLTIQQANEILKDMESVYMVVDGRERKYTQVMLDTR